MGGNNTQPGGGRKLSEEEEKNRMTNGQINAVESVICFTDVFKPGGIILLEWGFIAGLYYSIYCSTFYWSRTEYIGERAHTHTDSLLFPPKRESLPKRVITSVVHVTMQSSLKSPLKHKIKLSNVMESQNTAAAPLTDVWRRPRRRYRGGGNVPFSG